MDGGRIRDLVVLRATLAIACVALTGLIAAPAALASSPAGDQYGSALPGGGSGNSDTGSSSGNGTETTIPVAGDSSSSSPTGSDTSAGSANSGGTQSNSSDTGSKGGSANGGDSAKSATGTATDNGDGALSGQNTSHSVPQIAADSAGDSWVPFFIAGLLALACAAVALVFFRNRRRTAQG